MRLKERLETRLALRLPARAAFSLIELLALVPVFGLALAALFATTHRTSQQEHLAACLSNLRTIGEASLTYAAEDADEIVIPVPALESLPDAPGIFGWGGKAGSGQRTIPGQIHTSIWGTATWRGPAHRPLNRYLYKTAFANWNPIGGPAQPGPGYINYIRDTMLDLDFYRCPSDTGYAGGGFAYTGSRHRDLTEVPFRVNQEGLASAYDFYGTSYSANALGAGGGVSGSPINSYSAYLRPLSGVPAPADSVMYQEVPFRCAWLWGDWSHPSCDWTNREALCQGNFSTISGWHGTNFGGTVTFVDGHSAMVIMQGCMRPPPNLGSTNYPPGCSASIPPYTCFACVTIRGPGWQLDTFPAEPIVTPWYATEPIPPSGPEPTNLRPVVGGGS